MLLCGQEGHFIREFRKNKQGGGNSDNRAQSSLFVHQAGQLLQDPLLVLAEGQIVSMQSLASKSKKTIQLLLRV